MVEITATMSISEYRDLDAKANRFKLDDVELQALCSKICDEMPVSRPYPGGDKVEPWGCILSGDGNHGYCDRCPVDKICPYPAKNWSK